MPFTKTLVKCLIWLGCLFCSSAVSVALAHGGVTLGGVPAVLLFALACYAARSFCADYDQRHSQPPDASDEGPAPQAAEKEAAPQDGAQPEKMGEIVQLPAAAPAAVQTVPRATPRAGKSWKVAAIALSVLSAALAVSCCLMGYHLQCTQKSLSVSQRQVIEAASYLRYADSVVDDYAGRIETYIQYPSYARRADRYDFSRTFENYQRDHKVPDPNPFPWNKAIPIEK